MCMQRKEPAGEPAGWSDSTAQLSSECACMQNAARGSSSRGSRCQPAHRAAASSRVASACLEESVFFSRLFMRGSPAARLMSLPLRTMPLPARGDAGRRQRQRQQKQQPPSAPRAASAACQRPPATTCMHNTVMAAARSSTAHREPHLQPCPACAAHPAARRPCGLPRSRRRRHHAPARHAAARVSRTQHRTVKHAACCEAAGSRRRMRRRQASQQVCAARTARPGQQQQHARARPLRRRCAHLALALVSRVHLLRRLAVGHGRGRGRAHVVAAVVVHVDAHLGGLALAALGCEAGRVLCVGVAAAARCQVLGVGRGCRAAGRRELPSSREGVRPGSSGSSGAAGEAAAALSAPRTHRVVVAARLRLHELCRLLLRLRAAAQPPRHSSIGRRLTQLLAGTRTQSMQHSTARQTCHGMQQKQQATPAAPAATPPPSRPHTSGCTGRCAAAAGPAEHKRRQQQQGLDAHAAGSQPTQAHSPAA